MELKLIKNMMIYIKLMSLKFLQIFRVMINNDEKGTAMLRIAEVIGRMSLKELMRIQYISL